VAQRLQAEYDRIRWEHGKHADALFAAWCEGRTGYPLVDAAMHQINQTGYMHNRLRMVVASFLTRTWASTGAAASAYFAPSTSTTSTWPPTTAAGNGRLQRLRRAALLPHLQPGEPEREVRPAGQASSAATCRNWPLPDAALHAPWYGLPR
jgi:deoxyribodipyrimidine photo-lyase